MVPSTIAPRPATQSAQLADVDELYLSLLKGTLTRSWFSDSFSTIPRNTKTLWRRIRWTGYDVVQRFLKRFNLALAHTARPTGETMIGMGALENLEACVREVLRAGVPGDLCETGVWRGGACIYMRALLHVHGDTERRIWACDSFEGLPKPNEELYPQDKGSNFWEQTLAVSVDEVKGNFRKYGLLDDRTVFLKGFFSDTMPTAPIDRLAVLRLDGDMYESTIVVLRHLYPKLSAGGYVIIDDYGMVPECDRAVEDYRREAGVTEPIQIIGHVNGKPLGAYWKKQS